MNRTARFSLFHTFFQHARMYFVCTIASAHNFFSRNKNPIGKSALLSHPLHIPPGELAHLSEINSSVFIKKARKAPLPRYEIEPLRRPPSTKTTPIRHSVATGYVILGRFGARVVFLIFPATYPGDGSSPRFRSLWSKRSRLK